MTQDNSNAPSQIETLYVDPISVDARAAFELGPFRLVDDPAQADLIWFRKKNDTLPLHETLGPFQLLNHIPREMALGDKGRLAENLYKYDRIQTKYDFGVKDLVQETYCLYLPDQCARFFAQLPPAESKDNLWILKRCSESEGRGIHILWQFDRLREFCERAAQDETKTKYALYIIQRYIKNPLLLEGRKSEIRIYWLIASLDPLLVLLYREGTVRLNTLPFKLDDFGNTLVHVTNVVQQKAHPGYDPNAILKWSFSEWERYLIEDRKLAPKNFVREHLLPKLKRMLAFASEAAVPALSVGLPAKGMCFTLFGADIILDDTLHPWLTEIQEGPALDFDDPIKRALIPPMLNEAASIMLEIARRKREGRDLKTLDAVKNFEWVINQA